jgi:AcrR family transcriptional regulator
MRAETTKQKILTEALKLFSLNGYEAVSVEQIANAVGIKAPSLYKHYKGKRDIFNHILERMNEMDLERAKKYEMPEGNLDKIAAAYCETPIEKIKTYSVSLFLHWTEEEFSGNFRKMLTLEQYRNPEMSQLYQQYLSGGPLQYMAELFGSMTGETNDSMQIALEFYGPIFLLYSAYDGADDKEKIIAALKQHIDRFSQQLDSAMHKESAKNDVEA